MDTNETKKRRKWRGRSRRGCLPCKTRKVKCDESRPGCANCARMGKLCAYATDIPDPDYSEVPSALSLCWDTPVESEMFYRFTHRVAPVLARFYNTDFWTKVVPLVAQSQEQILDATLAVTTLYDIPISGAAAISARASKRYQAAIDWYCRSVSKISNGDVQGQRDIRLLLVSSILYLVAENRHMDSQNAESLLLSAYSIVYASRFELWNCRDNFIQACLIMLIDLSLSTHIDSSHIPRDHRQCAIILALKISAEFPGNELYQLKLEAASIMSDLNDLVSVDGLTEEDLGNDMNMDERLWQWQQSHNQCYETLYLDIPTQMALTRLEVLHLTCLVRYEDCKATWGNRERIESTLERILDLFGKGARFSRRIEAPAAIDAMDVNFVAGCIFVAWHWRHPSVLPRIRAILHAFEEHSPDLVRQALEYMEVLVNTRRSSPTLLELELFGPQPLRSILYWQQQRCANHLVLLSRR